MIPFTRIAGAAHTMQHELRFIETLGDHSGRFDTVKLLRGYLSSLDRRTLSFDGGVMSETVKSVLREHARICLRGHE